MLRLQNVTLVCVETRAHELAKKAIDDCLAKAEFGDILICSDNFNVLRVPGAQYISVPDWPSKRECCEFCSFHISQPVKTSHILFIEWDSGIVDPRQWTDEFLRYDFIGAPWSYDDGHNVGNGGFSLRSKALMDFWAKNKEKFPVDTPNSDAQLCRQYRSAFETGGDLVWAPNETAFQFAFERIRPSLKSKHFGYHGMFNWPLVFDQNILKERMILASQNKYIRGCNMWNETIDIVPWLRKDLAA